MDNEHEPKRIRNQIAGAEHPARNETLKSPDQSLERLPGLNRNGVPPSSQVRSLPLEITSGRSSQRPPQGPPSSTLGASRRPRARPPSEHNTEFLNVPDQGVAGMQRKRSIGQRPVPGVGRPKPQPRTHGPRCQALYQYIGQDVDELSFNVNEVIEILMEVLRAQTQEAWESQNEPGRKKFVAVNKDEKGIGDLKTALTSDMEM